MSAEDVAVSVVFFLFALIPILFIVGLLIRSKYQADAERLIPPSWTPDFSFHSFPKVVINSATREIAFIDSRSATIVNFSDIRTWQHLWTEKTRTNPGILVSTTKTSRTNHQVKIVASGMGTPAIFVHSKQAAEICDAFQLYLG